MVAACSGSALRVRRVIPSKTAANYTLYIERNAVKVFSMRYVPVK